MTNIRVEEEETDEKRTWILSWSDRQASVVTMSSLLGARTVERDLPPNICEMGDWAELDYSFTDTSATSSAAQREKRRTV
jgi:hypothetical protein